MPKSADSIYVGEKQCPTGKSAEAKFIVTSNCNNNERKKHVPATLNSRTRVNVNVNNKLQNQDHSDEISCAKDKEFSEKHILQLNTQEEEKKSWN